MKQKPEQDSNLQKYIDSVDYEPRTKEEIRGAAKEVLRIVNSKKSDVSKTSHFLEPPVHRNYILKYSIAASITFLAVSTLLWYAFMGQNNEQKTLTEVKKQSAPPNAQVEKKSNADQAVILDSFNYSVQIRSFSMTNGKKSIAENSQADLLINEFKRN